MTCLIRCVWKNESKLLTKDTSCECKIKLDGRKCNSNRKWNNDKCRWKCKKHICEMDYIWNTATCSCKNGRYFTSIIDNSVITLDETIDAEAKLNNEETKTVPANFKKLTCKSQTFYILLAFLFITIALLISLSNQCYLLNIKQNQNNLLPLHDSSNKRIYLLINVL